MKKGSNTPSKHFWDDGRSPLPMALALKALMALLEEEKNDGIPTYVKGRLIIEMQLAERNDMLRYKRLSSWCNPGDPNHRNIQKVEDNQKIQP